MEGDRNTKYFHALASHKRRCNYIEELGVNGVIYRGNDRMREAARSYFKDVYIEEFRLRPKLDGLDFRRISRISRQNLVAVFTEGEVHAVLMSCNGDKALNRTVSI